MPPALHSRVSFGHMSSECVLLFCVWPQIPTSAGLVNVAGTGVRRPADLALATPGPQLLFHPEVQSFHSAAGARRACVGARCVSQSLYSLSQTQLPVYIRPRFSCHSVRSCVWRQDCSLWIGPVPLLQWPKDVAPEAFPFRQGNNRTNPPARSTRLGVGVGSGCFLCPECSSLSCGTATPLSSDLHSGVPPQRCVLDHSF